MRSLVFTDPHHTASIFRHSHNLRLALWLLVFVSRHRPISMERSSNWYIQAALQLDGLFEAYRIQLDQHYRCRPGFVKQRLADAVIHCCLKRKEFAPELTLDEVKNSAILWLHAFQLPTVQSQKITELQSWAHLCQKKLLFGLQNRTWHCV
ncbi:hypothetical protein P4S72_20100 [Vibrio sp. PP-XX7]